MPITISGKYTGSLINHTGIGFYRDVYTNVHGNTTYLAVTQLQATDARMAFPCMDEPALKAKFSVSLGRLQNMTSISNMPAYSVGVPM